MYPLAALVFFASIAVPVLKLVGLSVMLITTQTGRTGWLRDRTRLYHIVASIGRWSMIDIFMESLLGALVAFGAVVTIEPGVGAARVLRRRDPDDVRGRNLRPAADVGRSRTARAGSDAGRSEARGRQLRPPQAHRRDRPPSPAPREDDDPAGRAVRDPATGLCDDQGGARRERHQIRLPHCAGRRRRRYLRHCAVAQRALELAKPAAA